MLLHLCGFQRWCRPVPLSSLLNLLSFLYIVCWKFPDLPLFRLSVFELPGFFFAVIRFPVSEIRLLWSGHRIPDCYGHYPIALNIFLSALPTWWFPVFCLLHFCQLHWFHFSDFQDGFPDRRFRLPSPELQEAIPLLTSWFYRSPYQCVVAHKDAAIFLRQKVLAVFRCLLPYL